MKFTISFTKKNKKYKIFFKIMNISVSIRDIDQLIDKNIASLRLWIFLLNYIIKLNYFKTDGIKIFFAVYIIIGRYSFN
jgi:hypothetical protein